MVQTYFFMGACCAFCIMFLGLFLSHSGQVYMLKSLEILQHYLNGSLSPKAPITKCNLCQCRINKLLRWAYECQDCKNQFCDLCSFHIVRRNSQFVSICNRCHVRLIKSEGSHTLPGSQIAARTAIESLDPAMEKYTKMLKMGIHCSAVVHKMTADEVPLEKISAWKSQCCPREQEESPVKPNVVDRTEDENLVAPKRRSMRQVHWNKIDKERAERSIFGTMFGFKAIDITDEEGSRLEGIFGQEANAFSPKKKGKAGKVHILPPRRVSNISIMLKQFQKILPGGTNDIIPAVLRVDSRITVDGLKIIEEILPTSIEESQLLGFRGDLKNLKDGERWMLEVARLHIPRMNSKVGVAVTVNSFKERVKALILNVETIMLPSTIVLGSSSLRRTLEYLLAIGNHMNEHKNQAHGFTMRSLLKLAQTKATDGSNQTLIEFFVDIVVDRGDIEILDLIDELEKFKKASALSNSMLVTAHKELQAEVDACVEEFRRMKEEKSVSREKSLEKNKAASLNTTNAVVSGGCDSASKVGIQKPPSFLAKPMQGQQRQNLNPQAALLSALQGQSIKTLKKKRKSKTAASENLVKEQETFFETLREFTASAPGELDYVDGRLKQMFNQCKDMFEYLGEDVKSEGTSSQEVFTMLYEFCQALKTTKRKNDRIAGTPAIPTRRLTLPNLSEVKSERSSQ